jgi:hypothetical protein
VAEYTDAYGRTFQAHVSSSGQVTYGGQVIGQANPITQQYVSGGGTMPPPTQPNSLMEQMRLGFTVGERQEKGYYDKNYELTSKCQSNTRQKQSR